MWRRLYNFFIPHRGNDHRPSMLEEEAVVGSLIVIMVLVAVSVFSSLAVMRPAFIAAVYPSALVDMANDIRAERDIQTLSANEKLKEAAALKAEHMLENDYFAHYAPSGKTPWYWLREADYSFLYAGENLAMNFEESQAVNRAWMDSPAHRDNIVSNQFTEVGIAAKEGTMNGETTTVVVQMLGRPLPDDAQPVRGSTGQAAAAAGAEIRPPVHLEVTAKTDTFIAAKRTDVVAATSAVSSAVRSNERTPWYGAIVSNPARTVAYVLGAIASVLFVVVAATIVINIRRQHPRHVAYGLLLIVIAVSFVSINYAVADIVQYSIL